MVYMRQSARVMNNIINGRLGTTRKRENVPVRIILALDYGFLCP
jgi:hypothetical protein